MPSADRAVLDSPGRTTAGDPEGGASGAAASTTLTLIRHGRSVWHSDNRYAGASDVPLDEVGRAQAARLAEWAGRHPHDAVACSPLQRSRDTAAPVAEALGVSPEVHDALREMDFGQAEGHTLAEVRSSSPDLADAFLADPSRHPFPGAEAPQAAADRVIAGLRGLAEAHQGASVLVIGHNTVLRLALCRWLGIPLAYYRDVFPRLDNVALTRLRVPTDPTRPPALLCLNVPLGPCSDNDADTDTDNDSPTAASHLSNNRRTR